MYQDFSAFHGRVQRQTFVPLAAIALWSWVLIAGAIWLSF
jgi:hypothetical protein